jgi:hypothetical protein
VISIRKLPGARRLPSTFHRLAEAVRVFVAAVVIATTGGVVAALAVAVAGVAVVGLVNALANLAVVAIGAGIVATVAISIFAVISLITADIGFLRVISQIASGLRDQGRVAGVSVREPGWLLPATVREEYMEEWRAWLHDMSEAGEPWHRRLIELLVLVLVAAPRLAFILRLSRRRAVD